jgi:hypothetical protein
MKSTMFTVFFYFYCSSILGRNQEKGTECFDSLVRSVLQAGTGPRSQQQSKNDWLLYIVSAKKAVQMSLVQLVLAQ